MTWCAVSLGLSLDAVIQAAARLGLEEIPVGSQPSDVEEPIRKELALSAEYRKLIPGGSGRLLIIEQGGQFVGLWDNENDKGGIPGHVGAQGHKLVQAVAVLTSDNIFEQEQWIKERSEVSRDGSIISSYKDKEKHGHN